MFRSKFPEQPLKVEELKCKKKTQQPQNKKNNLVGCVQREVTKNKPPYQKSVCQRT